MPNYTGFDNHDCGSVDFLKALVGLHKGTWESCLIQFFIILSLNIIFEMQISRYIVDYFTINFAKGLQEN
jgi:hypothetical protein